MNFAQIMGLLRLVLGMGGAAALTANGFDGNAISSIVAHAATPGGLLELVPIVAAGAWSLYAHTSAATVDRAVKLTGGDPVMAADGTKIKAGSPLAVPASTLRAGVKTHLSPNG